MLFFILVEITRFELVTFWLPVKRATNCAIPPSRARGCGAAPLAEQSKIATATRRSRVYPHLSNGGEDEVEYTPYYYLFISQYFANVNKRTTPLQKRCCNSVFCNLYTFWELRASYVFKLYTLKVINHLTCLFVLLQINRWGRLRPRLCRTIRNRVFRFRPICFFRGRDGRSRQNLHL